MMNRPSRQQAPTPVSTRMQMLSGLPAMSDINNLFAEARKGPGKIFHLPWCVEAKGLYYSLACATSPDAVDPQWTLSAGGISGGLTTSAIWSHSSPDLDLILNLCLMESETPPATPAKDARTTYSELRALVSNDQALKAKDDYVPLSSPQASSGTDSASPGAPGAGADTHSASASGVSSQNRSISITPETAKDASMKGSLTEMPPNSLLQSLTLSKMTGRLIVRDRNESIELYFDEGNLVHASCRQGEGELAVLELLTWTQGVFEFFPRQRTTDRTISRRIDTIVLDCMVLVHNQQYLEKLGLNMSSYLIRRNLSLTETEFDNQTKNAHCTNREMLKTLYQQIDQHSTFFELLRKYPLSKLDWLPALYTLVTTSLVEVSDKPTQQGKLADLASVGVDVGGVRAAYQSVLRKDTGIMSFQLFLHFLEQEYYRYERSRMPFTLLVFSIAKDSGYGLEPLTEDECRKLAVAVDELKRKVDILGHFQSFDYGMILPSTGIAGAHIFANRIMEVVSEGTIFSDDTPEKIVFAGGLASLPEDSMKVELLLPAAIEAKNNARDTGKGVVAFKNLYKSQA